MNPLALLGFAFIVLAPVLGIIGAVRFGAVARREQSAAAMLLPGMLGVASLLIGSGLLLVALPGPSPWTLVGLVQLAVGVGAAILTIEKLRSRS